MTTGEVKDSELARRGGGGGLFGRVPHLITSVSAPTGSLLKQNQKKKKSEAEIAGNDITILSPSDKKRKKKTPQQLRSLRQRRQSAVRG